ncbi:hypothetical protein [Sphingomonas sp.]|uniref:hypothetical protein n=1 Tax=Sphingomonas sp. TaxID=28214 RepID=UPI001B2F7B08|nr:hypothetical protein [Sphingomonas sp.]MBO9713856.1 hypothetical protein [Sphingomonas sp.]
MATPLHRRRGAPFALTLIALALAVRVLLPEGWMPVATQGGFAITICSGTAGETAWIDAAGKLHKEKPAGTAADHDCAFASAGAPLATAALDAPVLAAAAQAVSFPAAWLLMATGRGLAAPPPPPTGPPATV